MTRNTKIIIGLAIVTSFAVGRFSNRADSKVSTDKQVSTIKDQIKDTHTTTTTTTTKAPDGTERTTTTVDQVSTVRTEKRQDSITKTETVNKTKNILNVSVLVAEDITKGQFKPLYGLSVSKEVLGPVTIGAFGLTSGTVGLSIGLNF